MSSPPLTSSGVFFVRESALIDASREKVWQVLLDLPSYGEWNPFTRKMYVVSESGSTVEDQTLEVGKLFVSAINMPPAGLTPPRMSGTSRVTTLDHDNFRVSWVAHDFPAWFFFLRTMDDAHRRGGED
ncbi:hypothetical protein MVEN_01896900 [Mycena venus]|uniref:SRPBCC domain-containing protein n=1 Tax=Mycena venus TaxID=2733690 RepID=A0A8H7CJB4_9AGAR|nr:hypothetical protein MVEN_01896900 [Mycena venus]